VNIDTLCTDLRQQIVRRHLLPGTKLSEVSLSRKWNVSRTPVREVLRRLEAEGFLSSERYKGFVVQRITLDDVVQLYTIKISLESLAGRLATPFIFGDPAKLAELEKLCAEMKTFSSKGNVRGYARANHEFHSFFWTVSGNKWLIKILENLDSQVHRFIVNALNIPNRFQSSIHEHLEICEKVRAGDGKGVEKAIGKHHGQALEDLKQELLQET
jgi:DNA-binding GntR family transcriptional regulator